MRLLFFIGLGANGYSVQFALHLVKQTRPNETLFSIAELLENSCFTNAWRVHCSGDAATAYSFEFEFLHYAEHLEGFNLSNDNLTDEFALSGVILSLLMLAFCAERVEDEYVTATRLRCWQWAVLVNYALLLAGIWLVFGTAFLGILYYNMLTTLVLFLLLFYSRLHIIPLISRKAAL